MKLFFFSLALACAATTSVAQNAAKPATAPKAATTLKSTARPAAGALPPGIPRVHGIMKTAFSLRYEDIKVGTGAEAQSNKMYKVFYTGWIAADGRKFDSSEDHRQPMKDADGKPIMGDDGKPKLAPAEPISFPQGFGRVIPGFDQGFTGMKIGGKRRLFIPWQLAYGAAGRIGPDPAHPVIPQKADLIFDIELVDVSDLQMPQNHPGMGTMPRPGMQMPPNHVPVTPPPASSAQPSTPPTSAPTAPATPPPADKPAQQPNS